jgi:hypothetical protein
MLLTIMTLIAERAPAEEPSMGIIAVKTIIE